MQWIYILATLAVGLQLPATVVSQGYMSSTYVRDLCQGQNATLECRPFFNNSHFIPSYIQLISVTVLSTNNSDSMAEESPDYVGRCGPITECIRTIHNSTDIGISNEYRHLYQHIASNCQGSTSCNISLPEYWKLIDDTRTVCGDGIQYFTVAKIDIECWVDAEIATVAPPPSTTPRTRPTTPTTTTPFPVVFAIYQPALIGFEKVILGVAIGLSLAILLVLLIVLYCCEKWRNHKRLGKLLRKLGAPKAEENAFDELDFGKREAWQDETQNLDALGEYTGVKPDEFMTLDKRAMVTTGQIMYDAPSSTAQKGTTCSTIDRLDRRNNGGVQVVNDYSGPIDYDTEENLELEQRMAAALQYEMHSGEHEENLV